MTKRDAKSAAILMGEERQVWAGSDNRREGMKADMRCDNLKVEFWESGLSGS